MITKLEVLERAEATSTEAMILKAQLRFTGYAIGMDHFKIRNSSITVSSRKVEETKANLVST